MSRAEYYRDYRAKHKKQPPVDERVAQLEAENEELRRRIDELERPTLPAPEESRVTGPRSDVSASLDDLFPPQEPMPDFRPFGHSQPAPKIERKKK